MAKAREMLTGDDPIQLLLGAVIRRRRSKAGITVDVLAEAAGTSLALLSKTERGLYTLDTKMFWKLCDELCASPSELWKEVEDLHADVLDIDKDTMDFTEYDLRLIHCSRALLGVKTKV